MNQENEGFHNHWNKVNTTLRHSSIGLISEADTIPKGFTYIEHRETKLKGDYPGPLNL